CVTPDERKPTELSPDCAPTRPAKNPISSPTTRPANVIGADVLTGTHALARGETNAPTIRGVQMTGVVAIAPALASRQARRTSESGLAAVMMTPAAPLRNR